MNKADKEQIGALELDFVGTIQTIINRNYIIDFGIIKKIITDGVVVVQMSAAQSPKDVLITTCVLAGLTSENITVNVAPKVNDKVIVFYPRRHNSGMFSPSKTEPLVDEATTGYTIFGGIAFLANQFKINHYKNVVNIDDKGIKATLGYDEVAKKNNINISALNDGTLEVANNKATATMSKEGNITAKNTNATLSAKDTGEISIANKAASISISNTGNVTIDSKAGLLSIKNSVQDLGKLLDEFLGVINFLKTPGYVISVDDAAKIAAIRVKLATLFSTGYVPPAK